jgi:hypothetical protein
MMKGFDFSDIFSVLSSVFEQQKPKFNTQSTHGQQAHMQIGSLSLIQSESAQLKGVTPNTTLVQPLHPLMYANPHANPHADPFLRTKLDALPQALPSPTKNGYGCVAHHELYYSAKAQQQEKQARTVQDNLRLGYTPLARLYTRRARYAADTSGKKATALLNGSRSAHTTSSVGPKDNGKDKKHKGKDSPGWMSRSLTSFNPLAPRPVSAPSMRDPNGRSASSYAASDGLGLGLPPLDPR